VSLPDGFSRPQFISPLPREVSLATVMLILRTVRQLLKAPRCAWQKPGLGSDDPGQFTEFVFNRGAASGKYVLEFSFSQLDAPARIEAHFTSRMKDFNDSRSKLPAHGFWDRYNWLPWQRLRSICLKIKRSRHHAVFSKNRERFARTVLAASRNCRATWRTDALSHANPTASSKRLLNGALLGNLGTFSTFAPHCGQHTRYTSMTTVVRYSPHGRSRTSRSL
jgi:hypothetical protein